ncbi:MAG: acyl-CoA dehydrogenase family protein [Mycobacteriales bacterium]
MDLAPTPEQERFRSELRDWLARNRPEGPLDSPDLGERVAALRAWQRRLCAAGWVGVSWPREYGGGGLGPVENFVVQEEFARAGAPELAGRIGLNLAGPTLLAWGTDAQRARFLPGILDASELWCQLFSEPEAGSDLASLTTRAEPVAGGFSVSGAKVWTSYAQFADWGICLARTEPADTHPRHRGLSFLVVDLHAPGVTVRPLRQLTGEEEFNEVFLDAVFVPAERLVGPRGAGWQVAGSTLAHERGTSPRQLVIHLALVEDLLRQARASGADADPRVRQRLAQSYVEMRLFQLHNWRALASLAQGRPPGPEGSLLKLYWSQASQRMHAVALAVLGPAAPLWQGATGNPGDGRWQRSWLYYSASSVWAGTNEIQRTIVGERVLGLPREPEVRT